MGNLIISNLNISKFDQNSDEQLIYVILEIANTECSSIVKTEIAISYYKFISKYHNKFKVTAFNMFKDLNTTIFKIFFISDCDWDRHYLKKISKKKLEKMKLIFYNKFINFIFNNKDKETLNNAYLQVFKSALQLMFDSTPDINKTIFLYLSTILPVFCFSNLILI